MDLVDTPINEDAAPVETCVAPPSAGPEKGFLMELHQAQVPDSAAIHYLLALAHCGHETHIFRHHQGDASLAGSLNNLSGSFKITGDGLFYQDVLASAGCQGYVLQVQVVRGTNVQGIYLGVGGGFSIRAVGPASLKGF
jgi:hypothetical protein